MDFQDYLSQSRNAVARYNGNGNGFSSRQVSRASVGGGAQAVQRSISRANGVMNSMGAGYLGANGGGQPDYSNIAPLFGIQVQNTTTGNLTNVDILGSFQYTPQSALFTGGNYVSGGVTISTVFSTINYQQFLTSSATQQFKVGAIHVLVTAGSSANAQAFDVLTVTTQSQSGAVQSIPVKQLLNPQQFQSGVTQNYINFIVDGFTKITLANLYASTTVQYSFFPQLTQNPSGNLVGQGNTTAWGGNQLG